MIFVSRQAHLRLMRFIHVITFNDLTLVYLHLIRTKKYSSLEKSC